MTVFATPKIRFHVLRKGFLLVDLPGLEAVLVLAASLESEPVTGVEYTMPAARTLLIAFDERRLDVAVLEAEIASRSLSGETRTDGPLVEIPVRYDGPDLGEVAGLTGLSQSEVVRRHSACTYQVAFTGFAPGFAYLVGGDPALDVPRRDTPRTVVPAGSLAIAGGFTGIYPKDSPGGWRLIGSTPLEMFDLDRTPAALLQPGFRVRLVDMAKSKVALPARSKPARQTGVKGVARLEIISTLLPVLVQDEGRPGQAGQGLSSSGAADKASYRLANRIVGNQPGLPALEITQGNVRFRVEGNVFAAVAGAPAPVSVTRKNGTVIQAGRFEIMALRNDDVVSIATPDAGLRSYFAVRGGLVAERVIGSAARDMLSQIGPVPLMAGSSVEIGAPPQKAIAETAAKDVTAMPRAGETVVLDVILGPRADWFTAESIERFLAQEWRVTPQSSRVGIRLAGEAMERIDRRELPSEPTLQGAVQIPASGQPVVFLTDHPVTGGYPVVACVCDHHLDLCGQIPVGARVRFNPVAV